MSSQIPVPITGLEFLHFHGRVQIVCVYKILGIFLMKYRPFYFIFIIYTIFPGIESQFWEWAKDEPAEAGQCVYTHSVGWRSVNCSRQLEFVICSTSMLHEYHSYHLLLLEIKILKSKTVLR